MNTYRIVFDHEQGSFSNIEADDMYTEMGSLVLLRKEYDPRGFERFVTWHIFPRGEWVEATMSHYDGDGGSAG